MLIRLDMFIPLFFLVVTQHLISLFFYLIRLCQSKVHGYSAKYSQTISIFLFQKSYLQHFLYLIKKMAESQPNQSYQVKEKKIYRRVSCKNKLKLLQMVLSQGKKIRSSAKVLRINESTAKMIISRHKKNLNKAGEVQQKIVVKETQIGVPFVSEDQKKQEGQQSKIVWIQMFPVVGVTQYYPYFSYYHFV